ncbi:peptidase C15 [Pleurocapsales cyanobacterium LEGE 10410]|nr:peptidase C15 [Pleurocapsales cyanobacterium LEGE 10410]
MPAQLLLTSFQTWLPHQTLNSSDVLLEIIQERQFDSNSLFFLRKLPVNVEWAADRVVETIELVNPQGVVCCGMAETRKIITVESNAVCGENCIFTEVNLNQLVDRLADAKISHDAGKFVCEGLYYQVLNYIRAASLHLPCIFVHIPTIDINNVKTIEQDFNAIIRFMQGAEE